MKSKRHIKESFEYDDEDAIAFYKAKKLLFPIILRMAKDYFPVLAISAPAEALISQIGDVISNERNNSQQTPKRMIAIIKSLGIFQDDEIREKYSNIEDNVKIPDDLSEERKSAETKVWITIDDNEDVDISIESQVFRE